MKKIFKLLLFVSMLIFPFAVKAAQLTLTSSGTVLEPGQTVVFTVGVPQELGSITVTYSYDSSKLTYVSYEILKGAPQINTESKMFVLTDTNGFSGDLIKLTFKAADGATSGNSIFKVTTDDCSDKAGNDVTLDSAKITLTHRVKSSDATLKSLIVNDGKDNNILKSLTLSTEQKSVEVKVLVNDSHANASGDVGVISLNCGNNSKSVKVTAEDGTVKSYDFNITRTCSSNALLQSLSVQPGVISFDKNVKSYSVNVEGTVKSITISAKAEDKKSVVAGDGAKNIKYGINNFTVTVTAEDGTKSEYTITVNRVDNRNEDNKLKSLSITDFYKPGEDALLVVDSDDLASKNSYNLTVDNEVQSINVKAVANDSTAKVSGNVGKINLKVGSNKINITVTAENEEKNVYSIIVVRKADDGSAVDLDEDNSLSMVSISGYSFDFDPEVFEYEIELDEVVDQLELSAIPSSENATINILGNEDLKPGVNEVIIEVTSESGEVKKYVLKVKLPGGETGSVAVESTTNNNVKPEEKKGSSVLLILCGVLVAAGIGGVVFVLLSKKKKNKDTNDKPVDKVEPASSLLSTNEVKTETNTSSNLNASSSVSSSNTNSNNSILEQAAVLETAKASEPIKEEPKVEPIPSIDIRPVSATTPSVEIKPVGMDLPKVSEPVVSPAVEESPVIKSEPSINTSDFANIAESAVSQSIPDVRTIPEVRDIPEPHEMPEEKLVSEIKTVSEVSDNTLTDTQLVQTIQNVSVENINIDDL